MVNLDKSFNHKKDKFKIINNMAFNEGGMATGLLIIAVSIVFAAATGFLVLHFIPGTPF